MLTAALHFSICIVSIRNHYILLELYLLFSLVQEHSQGVYEYSEPWASKYSIAENKLQVLDALIPTPRYLELEEQVKASDLPALLEIGYSSVSHQKLDRATNMADRS